MTSNHHASYVLGHKRATMGITKRSEIARWSKPQKDTLNSDCGLKLARTKPKLLVIPNQNVGVNAFPGLVHTACQAMRAEGTQSRWANPQGRQPPKVKSVIGVKS